MEIIAIILSSGVISAVVSSIISHFSKNVEIKNNWEIQLKQINIEMNFQYAEKLEDLGAEYIKILDNFYSSISSFINVQQILKKHHGKLKNSTELEESLSEKVLEINSSIRIMLDISNRLKFVVPEGNHKDCLLDSTNQLVEDAQFVLITFSGYVEESDPEEKGKGLKIIKEKTNLAQFLAESFIEDLRGILLDLKRP